MLIQKSKIKNLINEAGYRLNPDALDGINRAVESAVKQILSKVEADGMKTVMPQHAAVNGTVVSDGADERKCQRCSNIKDIYVRWARETQSFCHEQAVVLSRKV